LPDVGDDVPFGPVASWFRRSKLVRHAALWQRS
jgi:hypothetical protein